MTDQAVARAGDAPDRMIQFGDAGMELHTLQEAYRFAQYVVQANMAPKGDREPAVVVKMAAAMSLRLDPIWGLSNLTFTNGRIGIMGDAACAVIRERKLTEGNFPLVEYTGKPMTPEWTCRVGAKRVGHDDVVWRDFSLSDAVQAGLVKIDPKQGTMSRSREGWGTNGPWASYPKRMLYYRALGFLVRDVFSDALMGCYVAEELRDFPSPVGGDDRRRERDVTPPQGHDPLLTAGGLKKVAPEKAAESEAEASGRAKAVSCPECGETAIDFKGTDENPTTFMCRNEHEWPAPGNVSVADEPCGHPDGFARMDGYDEPICVHCRAPMPDSFEGEIQGSML